MYDGDEYFEPRLSLDAVENYNSFSKFSQIQTECKNPVSVHCPNLPDNKGDSAAVTWNEEYSERLATFMKHSKSLLENIDRKQNCVKLPEMNNTSVSNENIDMSKSPTHTLIELEEKLLQLDDPKYKFNWETDIENSTKTSSLKDTSKIYEKRKTAHNIENILKEAQMDPFYKKHNFQEALRIDELETQLIVLKKQLEEKECKVKNLQAELRMGRECKEKSNKTIYRNLFTEFNNTYYSNTNIEENEKSNSNISRDQKKNSQSIAAELTNKKIFDHYDNSEISNIKATSKTVHHDQQTDIVESLSIKDYNPNNPIALQNKIKDLESQIQDLQEANEIASNFVSTIRDNRNDSHINPNSAISELIVRNQNLREEVEKLRQNDPVLNGDSLSSRFLRNELVNLKEDLFILKQQNNMIVIENKKLKSIIQKSGFLSTSEINDGESFRRERKRYNKKTNKRANYQIRRENDCMENNECIENEYEKNILEHIKQMNGDNCLNKQNNMEFSNDSTDSILSDVNKQIEDYQIHDFNFRNRPNSKESIKNGFQNKFLNLNADSYEFSESKDYLTLDTTKTHSEPHESYNVNKFSTLGRTAFAPRSGSDININDVVKFIRQGGRISKGLVHFIGHLPKRNDIYLGIELEIEDGKHDGIYEGKRYFQCRKHKGVFVAFNKIIMVYSNKSQN